MIQCRICGCKFDEKNVKPCGCSCAFGGCHGNNDRCPNCGYDMPRPKEFKKTNNENFNFSVMDRIKSFF